MDADGGCHKAWTSIPVSPNHEDKGFCCFCNTRIKPSASSMLSMGSTEQHLPTVDSRQVLYHCATPQTPTERLRRRSTTEVLCQFLHFAAGSCSVAQAGSRSSCISL